MNIMINPITRNIPNLNITFLMPHLGSNFKHMIYMIIERISKGKKIEMNIFPFHMKRLIESSEDIKYLLNLFGKL